MAAGRGTHRLVALAGLVAMSHASALPARAGARLRAVSCPACGGTGTRLVLPKKERAERARARAAAAAADADAAADAPPTSPRRVAAECAQCAGDGVVPNPLHLHGPPDPVAADQPPDRRPLIAIVGGGIGGAAAALGLQQRGLRAVVFEADGGFDERSQGYALTLQQGHAVLRRLGLALADEGIVAAAHVSFRADGAQLGRFGDGRRTAAADGDARASGRLQRGRGNLLVARQQLRAALLAELEPGSVRWGHRLIGIENAPGAAAGGGGGGATAAGAEAATASEDGGGVRLRFSRRPRPPRAHAAAADAAAAETAANAAAQTANAAAAAAAEAAAETVVVDAALVVGADGIWSAVRRQLLPEAFAPLRPLGVVVILGRARCEHTLARGSHIWEVVDGRARLYAMPFDAELTMWQLSFPVSAEAGARLGRADGAALRAAALEATAGWCEPVAALLVATAAADVTGYPAFDRPLPSGGALRGALGARVVLLGDALHPMSPFKGQGANQALLDGLELARALARARDLGPPPAGLRAGPLGLGEALGEFEAQMLARARVKVDASALAADVLHSPAVLAAGDCTRVRARDARTLGDDGGGGGGGGGGEEFVRLRQLLDRS